MIKFAPQSYYYKKLPCVEFVSETIIITNANCHIFYNIYAPISEMGDIPKLQIAEKSMTFSTNAHDKFIQTKNFDKK